MFKTNKLMLPRNASILLVLMICFAQNIPTHSFYYETESKIDVEISGKRILIKFKSNVDAGEQLKVISQKKDVLVLGSIQNLSFSQVLIVKMKNIVSLAATNVLIKSLNENESVEYANKFLIHPERIIHGISDRILLKLNSVNQLSLVNQIIYDFQGVTGYTCNQFDECLIEINVHKDRNVLDLANEIHETGIFANCRPDFIFL